MNKKPVILCIGATSVIGDSIGPRVGDILRRRYNPDAFIYGSSENPVNGRTFDRYRSMISQHHKENLIVSIDASLGKKEDIGKIKILRGGLIPGGAFNKNFCGIGDIAVHVFVAEKSSDNLSALMSLSEDFIQDLAMKTALKIMSFIYNLSMINKKFNNKIL